MNVTSFLITAFVLAVGFAPPAAAANAAKDRPSKDGPKPLVVQALRFAVSPPVADLARSQAAAPAAESEEVVEVPMMPLPKEEEASSSALRSLSSTQRDGAIQSMPPQRSTPGPSLTFDGINNLDNANAFGFRVLPPDTNGDVGPSHYVQMVNLLFRVYSKTGTPLTPPTKLSSLFAPLGGICSTNDNGDPIVLYDHLADRWLLSQFAFMPSNLPPYHECIAISTTGNPAGSYFLYDFVTPGAEFPDYPKIGVWPDAYYMTANQFTSFGPFNGTGAYAFERAKMLVGDPSASFIYFNLDLASHPEGIGGMLPSDLDGPPPPAGAPNTFAYFTALNFADPADGLRLFDFHADFAVPANSTFTERPESSYATPVPVAAFDPTFNSLSGPCPVGIFTSRDDIDQPLIPGNPAASCNAKLDAIGDRLLHRMQYRNFGSRESLVVNHSVDVNFTPPSSTTGHQAGVRYYELRRTGGGAYGVSEQATFAPDSDHRWMGSAAMDGSGDLAVGYSVSSTSTFPSLRYAARGSCDPPGGLFQGEATLHAGAGSQANTGSRWGDYSALSVDPSDDCSFWFTSEYYNATNSVGTIPCSSTGFLSNACWSTRIGKFRFPTCIAGLSASPSTLWPPNHKFRNVAVNYTVGAGATCSLSVTSNEPINGTGDGDTAPDWTIVNPNLVKLRAERAGNGTGRIYTITVNCTDSGGGCSSRSTAVVVPHDQGS